ncbi:MAG: hypothetical protein EAZ08_11415 [Cytophagales bacterium]|nr:MAG: hypothetical protein EAZ08_11415 [Cytophagales bacterium]
MRFFFVLISTFLFLCGHIHAQIRTFGIGRASGMGNAAVTLHDEWSVFNNIGGLAWIEKPSAFTSFDNRYGMTGFSTVTAGVVTPTKFGMAGGLSISQFGGDAYRETNLSIGISHKISNVSIGLRANYFQLAIEGLGTRRMMTFEFGGVMKLTETVWLGAHIYNFNQAKIADFQDERLPVVMKAGLSYRPTEKLIFNLETEKDIAFPQTFKAGLEYKILTSLALRTGISTKPFVSSYGFSFAFYAFEVVYSLNTHPQLQPSHHLALAYQFRKLKKKEKEKQQ